MPEAGGVGTPPGALGSLAASGKPASNRAVLLPPKACTCDPPLEAAVGLSAICPQMQKPRHAWGCPPPTRIPEALDQRLLGVQGPSLSLACLTRAKPGDDSYCREGGTLPVMPAFSARSAPAPSPPSPWSTSFIHLPSPGLLLQSMNQDSDLGRSLRISEPRFSHP